MSGPRSKMVKDYEPVRQFNLHIPITDWEDIVACAAKAGVTKSDLVRSFIRDGLKNVTAGTTLNEITDHQIVANESLADEFAKWSEQTKEERKKGVVA
jgi:hypothetical protein